MEAITFLSGYHVSVGARDAVLGPALATLTGDEHLAIPEGTHVNKLCVELVTSNREDYGPCFLQAATAPDGDVLILRVFWTDAPDGHPPSDVVDVYAIGRVIEVIDHTVRLDSGFVLQVEATTREAVCGRTVIPLAELTRYFDTMFRFTVDQGSGDVVDISCVVGF